MLRSTPMAASVVTRDDPPELIRGNVMPVIGKAPETTPILIIAWETIIVVIPTASSFPKGSSVAMAIRKPRHANRK